MGGLSWLLISPPEISPGRLVFALWPLNETWGLALFVSLVYDLSGHGPLEIPFLSWLAG